MPRPVAQVRAFHLFYSTVLGATQRGYLGTPWSMAEARALWELALTPGTTAQEILGRVEFDQGHLSRILTRLQQRRMLSQTPTPGDARVRLLRLTRKGQAAFKELDDAADADARTLLGRLTGQERADLLGHLAATRAILAPREGKVRFRQGRVGDLGWMFWRQAVVYRREFGYSDVFERYLAESLPPFLKAFDARRDRIWVAELEGHPVGFIAIQHDPKRRGWAKLRWFLVEAEGRGRGIGGTLLRKAVVFARRAKYRGIYLWTVDDLDAARRQYEKAGFALAEQTKGCPWARWGREQRWVLRLA